MSSISPSICRITYGLIATGVFLLAGCNGDQLAGIDTDLPEILPIEIPAGGASETHSVLAILNTQADAISVVPTPDFRARLRWSPGFMPGVRSYKVVRTSLEYSSSGYMNRSVLLTETLAPGDTSFIDVGAVFGRRYWYQLIGQTGSGGQIQSPLIAFGVDRILEAPISRASYSPALASLYIVTETYPRELHRVDLKTGTIAARSTLGHSYGFNTAAVSPDGKWLVASAGDELLKLDPLTLKTLETFSTLGILPIKLHSPHLNVANNGLMLLGGYEYIDPTFFDRGIYLIDLNTRISMGRVQEYGVEPSQFSPSGSFAATKYGNLQTLFDVRGTAFSRVRAHNEGCLAFLSDTEYVTCSETGIIVRDVETGTVRRSISRKLRLPLQMTVDPLMRRAATFSDRGWIQVTDLDTGVITHQVEAESGQTIILAGSTLVSSKGVSVTLP